MLTPELQTKIRSYINKGIFTQVELAKALKLKLDKFQALLDDDDIILIGHLVVEHKANLIEKMQHFSNDGWKVDEVQMHATKFLLASLHGLTEKHMIEREELELKKQTNKLTQTLKAAELSTKWGEEVTERFIDNVKKVGDYL